MPITDQPTVATSGSSEGGESGDVAVKIDVAAVRTAASETVSSTSSDRNIDLDSDDEGGEDDDDAGGQVEEEEEDDDDREFDESEDDDEDEVEDEEEGTASDDESETEPARLTNSKSSSSSPKANRDSSATVNLNKRDSNASPSPKSSPKPTQQASRSKQNKGGDVTTTFKTRVFTNKSLQSRNNNNNKQQQLQHKNQSRKNSNESSKALKVNMLLIEEMFQPVARKPAPTKPNKAQKKVTVKEESLANSNSLLTGDETSQLGCNKSKSKNFSHNQAGLSSATTTATNKNWGRKSQTFTAPAVSGPTATKTGNSCNGDAPTIHSASRQSPPTSRMTMQPGTTMKKLKPAEKREIVSMTSAGHLGKQTATHNSSQVSMVGAARADSTPSQAAVAAGKKSTLHQYKKLNLSDEELVRYLHHYLLDVDSLKLLGFPVECEWNQERAVIFKPTASEFYSMRQCQRQPTDIYAPSGQQSPQKLQQQGQHTTALIPTTVEKCVEEDMVDDGIVTDESDLKLNDDEDEDEDEAKENEGQQDEKESTTRRRKRRSALDRRLSSVKLLSSSPPSSSSGHSSGIEDSSESNSSLPGSPSMVGNRFSPASAFEVIPASDEKKCSRCGRGFFVTVDGEYLTQEHCVYHYGRVQRVLNTVDNSFSFEYSCCAASPDTKGCTTHSLHVWSGLSEGCNGPYLGFVNTARRDKAKVKRKLSDGPSFVFCADLDHLDGVDEQRRSKSQTNINKRKGSLTKVYALDCEMCFTGRGLELGKVTVVAHDGSLVYEKFVKPESEIIDYNTRFSGIKAGDYDVSNRNNIRTIQEMQRDLLALIDEQTILIGHGLENDLRALKLIHNRIIDTSIAFPHFSGLPFRRSLKSLTKTILKRDIQTCQTGHDSYEDSLACVELMLWRVRKDFRTGHSNAASHGGAGAYQSPQQHPPPQHHQKRYHGNGNSNGISGNGGRWH